MIKLSILLCSVLSLIVSVVGCSQKQDLTKVSSTPSGEVVATTTKLATIVAHGTQQAVTQPPSGQALPANPDGLQVVFHDRGRAAAYIAEGAGSTHVVHNGKPGKSYQQIKNVSLSPDGLRIAYAARRSGKWQLVVDGNEGAVFDEIGIVLFSPDSRHIAYQAYTNKKIHIVVDNKISGPYQAFFGDPVFSGDSTKLMYVEDSQSEQKKRLIISDLALCILSVREPIGDLFVTNSEKTKIAAIQSVDGQQRVIEIDFAQPKVVKEGRLYDIVNNLAFGSDGSSLVYPAEKGIQRVLILNGKEALLPDGNVVEAPVVRPNKGGVGVVMLSKDKVYLHHAFTANAATSLSYDDIIDLVYSRDGNNFAFIAKKGEKTFIVTNGNGGPSFDKVVSPQFSADNKFLVYRARQASRRFVVVADATNGKILRQHPGYEQVFQPVFTADGKSVAYGVKDGNELWWKVEKL